MTTPRLEIDLDKIHHNARTLVERLATRGIAVTGVTKATLGSPEIARALLRAGVYRQSDEPEPCDHVRLPSPQVTIR